LVTGVQTCALPICTEGAPIFEKERGEDGNKNQKPGVLGDLGHAQANALRNVFDLSTMVSQIFLELLLGVKRPTALHADLFHDLSRTHFSHQGGHGLAQLGSFMTDPRTYEGKEDTD